MKRIILGISVLFMLVGNGFAFSDAEYDINIKNSTGYMKQNIICEKEAGNYLETGDIKKCFKAVKILQNLPNSNPDKLKYLGSSIPFNAGLMAYWQGDKLNAYKYWMISGKYGDKEAQKNLDIMCKESPWACK